MLTISEVVDLHAPVVGDVLPQRELPVDALPARALNRVAAVLLAHAVGAVHEGVEGLRVPPVLLAAWRNKKGTLSLICGVNID